MRNMPPGFGTRPGDHEYFDYPDPDLGCDDCGAMLFTDEVEGGECDNCGGSNLVDL